MDAALNWIPIFSAMVVASLEGFISAVKIAANWVLTSAVLPLTPVSVAKEAISSSTVTPKVDAFAATRGNACANCSNDVTPFLAVSCILSWIWPASLHASP